MDISNISTEALEAELKRREKIKNERPVAKDYPSKEDYEVLKKICFEYLRCVEGGNYEFSDLEHYIFEEAMNFVFGKDVWDYVNSLTD